MRTDTHPPPRLRSSLFTGLAVALQAAMLVPGALLAQQQTLFEGQILGPNGKGVAAAEITLSHQTDSSVVVKGASDKKGKFSVVVLMPGPYEILVERKGFGPYKNNVEIVTGMEYKADLTLLDEATYKEQRSAAAFNEGVAALQGGNEESAETLFKESSELNPGLPNPHIGLASLYHGQERWEEAVASLEKFLAAVPLDAQLAPLAFDVYWETGDRAEAEKALAMVTDPAERTRLAGRVYNAGVASSQANDLDGAIALFTKAAEIDPQMGDAIQNISAIEFNRKNYGVAVPHLDRLLAIEPGNVEGLRLRYHALRELGDAEAEAALASYLAKAGVDGVGEELDRAVAEFEGGRVDPALTALRILVQTRPETALAHYHLGRVLVSKGQNAEAKQHLQHFVDAAPDHAEAAAAKAMMAEL